MLMYAWLLILYTHNIKYTTCARPWPELVVLERWVDHSGRGDHYYTIDPEYKKVAHINRHSRDRERTRPCLVFWMKDTCIKQKLNVLLSFVNFTNMKEDTGEIIYTQQVKQSIKVCDKSIWLVHNGKGNSVKTVQMN